MAVAVENLQVKALQDHPQRRTRTRSAGDAWCMTLRFDIVAASRAKTRLIFKTSLHFSASRSPRKRPMLTLLELSSNGWQRSPNSSRILATVSTQIFPVQLPRSTIHDNDDYRRSTFITNPTGIVFTQPSQISFTRFPCQQLAHATHSGIDPIPVVATALILNLSSLPAISC